MTLQLFFASLVSLFRECLGLYRRQIRFIDVYSIGKNQRKIFSRHQKGDKIEKWEFLWENWLFWIIFSLNLYNLLNFVKLLIFAKLKIWMMAELDFSIFFSNFRTEFFLKFQSFFIENFEFITQKFITKKQNKILEEKTKV